MFVIVIVIVTYEISYNIYKIEVKLIPLCKSIKINLVEVKCSDTHNIEIIGYYIMECGVGTGN
jgi:hypothetical protein